MLERAVFVIEPSGERVSCALNPNQLVFRRNSGFVPLRSLAGAFSATRGTDENLVFTGTSTTELELDLLFDVSLPGSSIVTQDVSKLTDPLWNLAESASFEAGYRQPSFARLIWGKAWNFRAAVTAAAQRFENFSAEGVARRAWLRLRLVRVPEQDADTARETASFQSDDLPELPPLEESSEAALGGEGPPPEPSADEPFLRLDLLAAMRGAGAAAWREIARENGIEDPLAVPWGQPLRIPEPGAPSE
jgi:hypothetical protein